VNQDPPSPLAGFRGIVGGALALAVLALIVVLIETGALEWRLVALVAALATFWRAGGALYDGLLEPTVRFLWGAFTGGTVITLEDEIADLEQRLADPATPPDREILAAVRLAEIYRRYRSDMPRSLALIDRLLLKYPDSHALRIARGLPAA
jgi:hypothetical protein